MVKILPAFGLKLSVMEQLVFFPSHYFQIFWSIVSNIVVLMVNHLRGFKSASYHFFSNIAMFSNSLAVYGRVAIMCSIRFCRMLSVMFVTTITGTVDLVRSVFLSVKRRTTISTFNIEAGFQRIITDSFHARPIAIVGAIFRRFMFRAKFLSTLFTFHGLGLSPRLAFVNGGKK